MGQNGKLGQLGCQLIYRLQLYCFILNSAVEVSAVQAKSHLPIRFLHHHESIEIGDIFRLSLDDSRLEPCVDLILELVLGLLGDRQDLLRTGICIAGQLQVKLPTISTTIQCILRINFEDFLVPMKKFFKLFLG